MRAITALSGGSTNMVTAPLRAKASQAIASATTEMLRSASPPAIESAFRVGASAACVMLAIATPAA